MCLIVPQCVISFKYFSSEDEDEKLAIFDPIFDEVSCGGELQNRLRGFYDKSLVSGLSNWVEMQRDSHMLKKEFLR